MRAGDGADDAFRLARGLRGHVGDEAFVERVRRVVAHAAEGLHHGGDLDQAGHVAAGADEELEVRDLEAEDFVEVFLQAGAFLDDLGSPLAQGHDEVEAFVQAHGVDAEHIGDVDDADAATLHVAAVQGAGGGEQVALVDQFHHREVVGYEGVAALDQGEGALRFSGAGLAAQHHAHAADIEGGGMDGGGGGKLVVDAEGGEVHPVHGDHRGAEDGQFALDRHGQHRGGGLVVAGQYEAGHLAVDHLAENAGLLGGVEGAEVGHLGRAHDLNTFVREIFEEAGERERGAVDGTFADEAMQAVGTGEQLQFQLLAVGLLEVRDGDAVDGLGEGHGGGGLK